MCSGQLLSCFHEECINYQEKANSNCINVSREEDDSTEYSMIIPVPVRRRNRPSKEVLQYAVLDDSSNIGFISQEFCDKFQARIPITQLLLSTVQEKIFL